MIANSQNIAYLLDYEKQIVHLLCEAKSDNDIAGAMGMSLRDVRICKDLIYRKTDTRNWAELVIYAIRKKIFRLKF